MPPNVRVVSHWVFCSFLLLLSHSHSIFNFQVPRYCKRGFSRVSLKKQRLLILGGSVEVFGFLNLLIRRNVRVCVIICMDSNCPGVFFYRSCEKTNPVCESKSFGAILTQVHNYSELLQYFGFLNTVEHYADKGQSVQCNPHF